MLENIKLNPVVTIDPTKSNEEKKTKINSAKSIRTGINAHFHRDLSELIAEKPLNKNFNPFVNLCTFSLFIIISGIHSREFCQNVLLKIREYYILNKLSNFLRFISTQLIEKT